MSTPNLLELHNISKCFGALTALRNLSFHIGEGEVVGLLGDNGAGKSTTVNLISGIHKPTDGYLSVDGKKTTFSCRSDSADAGPVRRMFPNNAVLMPNGHHDAGAPSVTMDEDQGIREAVADAAAKGVRSALLLTGRTMSRVEQARIASYRTALGGHGTSLRGERAGDYSYASGRALAPSIDVDATDAVFCTSDAMAMGVLDAHRRHFPEHRPARFRLYGFDNVSLTQFDAYPISSIGADKRDYVAQIVRILEQPARLARASEQVLVATRFVPRLTG